MLLMIIGLAAAGLALAIAVLKLCDRIDRAEADIRQLKYIHQPPDPDEVGVDKPDHH